MNGKARSLLLFILGMLFIFNSNFVLAKTNNDFSDYVTDELLVKFKNGVTEATKNQIHKKVGAKKLKDFDKTKIQHIKIPKDKTVIEAISEYQHDPWIEFAEPNYILHSDNIPNDPRFGDLWGLYNSGQWGGIAGADIKAVDAWSVATGSRDVVVAIVDTGIDYTHPDLLDNLWVNDAEFYGLAGSDDDGNGYVDDIYGIDTFNHDSDPFDDVDHGTHVAGTIGATGNNGEGVTGVNWEVQLLSCKFLGAGGGTTAGAIECLEYVKTLKERGVNIVATNNSWGGGGYSQALSDAINNQRDILFFAAAGNDGTDNDLYPHYPSAYPLPNIVSLAATDGNDNRALFSNFGRRSVLLGAPGYRILSSLPNNGYGTKSGTSMATPHATGLAALLRAQDANRSWINIKNLILAGGENTPSLDGIILTGKRLDAFASLTCSDRPFFSVLDFPQSPQIGLPETISALSINCDRAVGPVTVTGSTSESIELKDDGLPPDLASGDGIFAGTWTPSTYSEQLDFSSPSGSEVVSLFLKITTDLLPDAKLGETYTQGFKTSGGFSPFNWAIMSGSLPPGLVLDPYTGTISGVPTIAGAFTFTVQVADARGATAIKTLSILVTAPPVSFEWANSAGSAFLDYSQDAATDSDGNLYVTGFYLNGGSSDGLTIKFDSTGSVLWSRIYDRGGNEKAYAITTDLNNNAYIAADAGSGFVVIKYDPYGNIIWERTYSQGRYPQSIAVDKEGNYYLTGSSSKSKSNNKWLTVKFNPLGTVLWSAIRDGGASGNPTPSDISVDANGYVYVAGKNTPSVWNDFCAVKYDPYGQEVWARLYDGGEDDVPESIAVDLLGNVYVTGQTRANGNYNWITNKYDDSGNLLWTRTHDSGNDDYARGAAVDKAGNIYVTGNESGYIGFLTTKYDPEGIIVWQERYVTGAQSYATAVALDKDLNILLAGFGYLYPNGISDYIAVKYKQKIPLEILKLPMADGAVGSTYNQALEVIGGRPPYTWSLSEGSLPLGLSLDDTTGLISGIPSEAGTFLFTAQVSDGNSQIASRQNSILVSEGGSVLPGPEICSDGIDNDQDGKTDCSDRDCRNDAACSSGGSTTYPEICTDGIDNDGDGKVDCSDNDCRKDAACK